MSIVATKLAWQISKDSPDINPAKQIVMLRVAWLHHTEYGAKSSIRALAKACGLANSTVDKALDELTQAGVLVVIGEDSRGRRTARRYDFKALTDNDVIDDADNGPDRAQRQSERPCAQPLDTDPSDAEWMARNGPIGGRYA